MPFHKWVNSNLDIELEKAPILNIAYRDNDKDLVLHALTRSQVTIRPIPTKSVKSMKKPFLHRKSGRPVSKVNISSRTLDAFSIRYGISNNGGTITAGGTNLSNLQFRNKYGNIKSLKWYTRWYTRGCL